MKILSVTAFLVLVFVLAGCKSWRDGVSDYTEESYDSTIDFFDNVAVDFKIKDEDKYKRYPFENEVLLKNNFIELAYASRIERLTTIERVECKNMLRILTPKEEKELLEDKKTPEYGGVSLLYNLYDKAPISIQTTPSVKYEMRFAERNSEGGMLQAKLKLKPEYPEVLFSVDSPGKSISRNRISARFEFRKPLSIVFEDKSGKLINSRVMKVQPEVYFFRPPRKGSSDVIRVYGSWIIILYRHDMMIFARPKTKNSQARLAAYQFKTIGNKLIFDSIIPPMRKNSARPFSERWQVFYRPALYNPNSLTAFLMNNHIHNLYKP